MQATRATLRSGRVISAGVIRRQLDALASAGYELQPRLYDDGAELLLQAARRSFRSGHFSPAAVVARQLRAVEQQHREFVLVGEDRRCACETFEWGPDSFQACSRCGWSYWKHAESSGVRSRGAHRSD